MLSKVNAYFEIIMNLQNIFSTPDEKKRMRINMTPSPVGNNIEIKKSKLKDSNSSQINTEDKLTLSEESTYNSQNLNLELSPESSGEVQTGDAINFLPIESINSDRQSQDENFEDGETESNNFDEGQRQPSLDTEFFYKICKNPAEVETIECDGCQDWLHASCAGLKENDLRMINILDGKAKWYCEDCNIFIQSTLKDRSKTEKVFQQTMSQSSELVDQESGMEKLAAGSCQHFQECLI